MQEGWIKLYRNLLESSLFEHPELLKFWIWCLLKADHKETKTRIGIQEIHINKGQFIFGRKKAAIELNMKESTAYKYLKILEKEQRITIKSNNRFSVVTLINWEDYQKIEEKSNSRVTAEEQQSNNKETTTEQQKNNRTTTEEQQHSTYKNVKNTKNEENNKNVKNEKNIIKHTYPEAFEEFWRVYPRKAEKADAYKKYKTRLKDGFSEVQLLTAAKQYAEECKQEKREKRYTKQAKTFLSDSTPFLDYLEQTERSHEHDINGNHEPNRQDLIQEAMEAGINPEDFTGF